MVYSTWYLNIRILHSGKKGPRQGTFQKPCFVGALSLCCLFGRLNVGGAGAVIVWLYVDLSHLMGLLVHHEHVALAPKTVTAIVAPGATADVNKSCMTLYRPYIRHRHRKSGSIAHMYIYKVMQDFYHQRKKSH